MQTLTTEPVVNDTVSVTSPMARLKDLLLAALLTLALFVTLPLMDFLSPTQEPIALMDATRITSVMQPPPIPRVTPPRLEPVPPKPTLMQPQTAPAVALPLSLELASGDISGDFALAFQIGPADLGFSPDDGVFDLSQIDAAPQPIIRMQPLYPPRARMRQLEGEVQVEFVVTENGTVRDAVVTSSRPAAVFDEATLRAVARWTFEPAVKDGVPVPVRVRQRLQFKLEGN